MGGGASKKKDVHPKSNTTEQLNPIERSDSKSQPGGFRAELNQVLQNCESVETKQESAGGGLSEDKQRLKTTNELDLHNRHSQTEFPRHAGLSPSSDSDERSREIDIG